uniref:Uncharacterized protein n=1 Tax=Anguilla anguilla TaxID=7936 RepID=A0A0E9ULK1_ANGAN
MLLKELVFQQVNCQVYGKQRVIK